MRSRALFECDGFVKWVLGRFGITMPRSVSSQAARGIRISRGEAQAGDLVVYPGEHIGIYDGHGGIVDSPDWGRKVSHRSVWGSPQYYRIPG
ncbi:C40 family peptidase [Leifsonia shinshuensis]|uniref:C40 family peptidase n=1 Tax=Leifsonia shinshuensis TaxID=150026 RepID=UPI001F5084B9|nr:NlpC/P60 family protein [Leifsonia shinshuensis]MCI0158766.1 C40 family peptidase [Leifsonia shinshuensis]